MGSNMKLTIKDRVFIPGILPTEGGRFEMIAVRDLMSKIEFSSAELEEYGIRPTDKGVTWESNFEKEIEFSNSEKGIILDALAKADKGGKLPLEFISTWEKLYKYLQQ